MTGGTSAMAIVGLTMVMIVAAAVGVLAFVTAGHVVARSARLPRRLRARFVALAAGFYASRRRVGRAITTVATELAEVRDAWVSEVVRQDVVRGPGRSLLRR